MWYKYNLENNCMKNWDWEAMQWRVVAEQSVPTPPSDSALGIQLQGWEVRFSFQGCSEWKVDNIWGENNNINKQTDYEPCSESHSKDST